jgi:hypothetical protein
VLKRASRSRVLERASSWVAAWTLVSVLAVLFARPSEAACPVAGFTVVEHHASPDTRTVKTGGNQTLSVRRKAITTTDEISEIRLSGDDEYTLIRVKLTAAADQRLHDATTGHAGMRIAFVVDQEALAVLTTGPYGIDTGGVQLSIWHGMKAAQKLMKDLASCG